MKNRIKIFENAELGKVRVAGTSEEPLFCLSDVCKILDLHTGMTKQRLDEKGVSSIDTLTKGGMQPLIYISEKNLYKVIMRSDKPQAEPFQDWVCGEVLPSIRKTGGYIMAKQDETPEELMARALMIAQETLKRKEQRLLEAETKIKENAQRLNTSMGLSREGIILIFVIQQSYLGLKKKLSFIF